MMSAQRRYPRQSWERRGKGSDMGFRVSGLGFGPQKECRFANQGILG